MSLDDIPLTNVGLMVTGNTYRPPAVLAKIAATVERVRPWVRT